MERAVGIRLFIIGILTAGVALVVLALLSLMSEGIFGFSLEIDFTGGFVATALGVGALTEEILRVITLNKVVLSDARIKNAPLGGLLFGCGFALTELVLFVSANSETLVVAATLITTPLLHIILSILVVFLLQIRTSFRYLLAVAVPFTLHIAYNSLII